MIITENGILQRVHLLLLLLLAGRHEIHGAGNKGDCSYAHNVTLKFICNNYVAHDMYTLYRDYRAPVNTPYSVWQSDAANDSNGMIVLISFHDYYLHRFQTLKIEQTRRSDSFHRFSVNSGDLRKQITIQPSLMYCFAIGLRYPMELRSSCLGLGRSTDIAQKPVLHYAMTDYKPKVKQSANGSECHSFGTLLIIISVLVIGVP